MQYRSTRGAQKGLSFEQVLFSGYASDGGLYVPEMIPSLELSELETWKPLSYKQILSKIASIFIDQNEVSKDEMDQMITKAFCDAFPEEPVKLVDLQDGNEQLVRVLELFHGPTMAFKDLALALVAHLYEFFLKKRQKRATVLVGTSGDTGGAAIHATKDLGLIDTVVLLPKGGCTKIQELQMTTVISDNIHCFAVEGTSDDLDEPIKEVFGDSDYVIEHSLCSINSINWARVLFQMAHHAYAYLKTCQNVGDKVQVVVPTGACGNITGGFLLAQMGFPIDFVAAVNPNDIVHRLLESGDFSKAPQVTQTWASAIDIQAPYNIERIFYFASGLDTARVRDIMETFEKEQKVKIPEDILKNIKNVIVDSISVKNEDIIETIKNCHDTFGYVACPHTAVALNYNNQKPASIPRVVIATASPSKFSECLAESGIVHQGALETLETLSAMPTKAETMPKGKDWTRILKEKIEEITEKRKQF